MWREFFWYTKWLNYRQIIQKDGYFLIVWFLIRIIEVTWLSNYTTFIFKSSILILWIWRSNKDICRLIPLFPYLSKKKEHATLTNFWFLSLPPIAPDGYPLASTADPWSKPTSRYMVSLVNNSKHLYRFLLISGWRKKVLALKHESSS